MAFETNRYPMKRIYSATAVSGRIPEPHSENDYRQDELEIARFGKKQQLRVCLFISRLFPLSLLELINVDPQRAFGLVSIVGLTCTLMITWEGSLT